MPGKEEKGMTWSGWRCWAAVALLLGGFLGCVAPSSPPGPSLTAAAARHTLDSWNPSYCKVVEFYGIFEHHPNEREAFALIANPSEKGQNPQNYAARFQLLTLSEGQSRWFLTRLLTLGEPAMRRRLGWDNLLIPVKDPPAAAK